MSKKLSWKPVLRGKIYCSPACGGNCTQAQYLSAEKKARDLVKQLGPGWESRVHENLGWHYCAVHKSGYLSVHADLHKYHAFFDRYAKFGGRWIADGNTPAEAVKGVIKQVMAYRDDITSMLEALMFYVVP